MPDRGAQACPSPLGPRKIRELYLRQQGKAASESSFKRALERSGLTQNAGCALRARAGDCAAAGRPKNPTRCGP